LPTEPVDLETRIAQAEERLLARDQRVRTSLVAVRQRAQRLWQPWRLVYAVGGGLVALGGVWWLWRRRRGSGDALAGRADGVTAHRASKLDHFLNLRSSPRDLSLPRSNGVPAALPWFGFVGILWPLLPRAWRRRVSPATVSAGLALVPLVIGVARALLTRRSRQRRGHG
jgi:hypothetical protein